MKELSIAEKSKQYDEAIAHAKLLLKTIGNATLGNLVLKNEFERMFPELKESKNEKIRKHLISFFNNLVTFGNASICETEDTKVDDILAWLEKKSQTFTQKDVDDAYLKGISDAKNELEKQGEQKLTVPKWKYKNDNTPLLRDSLILNKYGCVGKSPSGALVSDVWVMDYDELAKLPKEEFEKRGEQKPTDKVEPNFKVGDKVICLESFDGFIKGQIYTCREEGWIGCDKQGNWTCRLDKFKVVDLQSPAKWSEEDENIKESIITGLEMLKDGASDKSLIALYNKKIEWLKSIRPQNTWKPDSSMLICLEYAIKHINKDGDKRILSKLLEQLKKLKGE